MGIRSRRQRSPFLKLPKQESSSNSTNRVNSSRENSTQPNQRIRFHLLLSLEILRGLDPEEIRQRAGDHPRSEAASAAQAAERISDEGSDVPERSPPAARHLSVEFNSPRAGATIF
ncbi:hypothetical protein ACLOJK_036251 [Asimina triloba]